MTPKPHHAIDHAKAKRRIANCAVFAKSILQANYNGSRLGHVDYPKLMLI